MSQRAAEMAKILTEEWSSENESAESFVRRRFSSDKLSDLKMAVEIMTELDHADNIASDRLKNERLTELSMDYLDYYSSMWDTLRVVDPISGVSLTYNNTDLCRDFPDWPKRDAYLRAQLRSAVNAASLQKKDH